MVNSIGSPPLCFHTLSLVRSLLIRQNALSTSKYTTQPHLELLIARHIIHIDATIREGGVHDVRAAETNRDMTYARRCFREEEQIAGAQIVVILPGLDLIAHV